MLVMAQDILISGKPHLGTDRLVLLLRAFRQRLAALGVDMCFGAAMADLLVEGGRVCGVRLRGGARCPALAPLLRSCISARGCQCKMRGV